MINLLYSATCEPSNSRSRDSESSTHVGWSVRENEPRWFLIESIDLQQKNFARIENSAAVQKNACFIHASLREIFLFSFYIYLSTRDRIALRFKEFSCTFIT